MEVFDHTQWNSTCPLLVTVLTKTWLYHPSDLSNVVGMGFVPSVVDLFCLLYGWVVQKV